MLVWLHMSDTAKRFLEPMTKILPDNIRIRGCLAAVCRDAGDFDAAIANFKKCLELDPDDEWVWGNLGIAYKDMERFHEAESCLRRALELNNRLVWAHCHLGYTLRGMGNYEEALEKFHYAIGLDADYGMPHLGLASTFRKYLRQPQNAVKEYEIAMQLEPRPILFAVILIGLARALEDSCRIGEARQRYSEYLDRFPWGEHAKEAQEALERLGDG